MGDGRKWEKQNKIDYILMKKYFLQGSKVSVSYFFPSDYTGHESQKSEPAVIHPVTVNWRTSPEQNPSGISSLNSKASELLVLGDI